MAEREQGDAVSLTQSRTPASAAAHPSLAWLAHGGVVLGIAISLYTIYSYVDARITHQRQQYALLRQIDSEFEYFIGMADSLANRAQQVERHYADQLARNSFPDPVRDGDSLPADAEITAKWLTARARLLSENHIPLDIEKVGAILNREQADALFDLLQARRVYLEVLSSRATDLEAFPRRPGVLKRFVGVAVLNVASMREKKQAFAASLGLGPVNTIEALRQ